MSVKPLSAVVIALALAACSSAGDEASLFTEPLPATQPAPKPGEDVNPLGGTGDPPMKELMPDAAKQPMDIEPQFDAFERRATIPTSEAEIFNLLDGDSNDKIDRGEWRLNKMLIFYLRDKDRSITLTHDEIPGLAESLFVETDVDHNGVISGYEFNQALWTQFEAADINADGFITRDEFTAFIAKLETGVDIK